MDKKLKISIDIDGTINSSEASVSFFRVMTHLLSPDPDINIVILTNREPGTEIQISRELAEMGIQYDSIVITSEKQNYIKDNNISVVFENEDENFKNLGKKILVLKAREEGNYNFRTYKWYGSKQTIEMVDE